MTRKRAKSLPEISPEQQERGCGRDGVGEAREEGPIGEGQAALEDQASPVTQREPCVRFSAALGGRGSQNTSGKLPCAHSC